MSISKICCQVVLTKEKSPEKFRTFEVPLAGLEPARFPA